MTEAEKDKMIEQQNQAIAILNERLLTAEVEKQTMFDTIKKLEQESTRLETVLATAEGELKLLKMRIQLRKELKE
jgi:hypothetical protein